MRIYKITWCPSLSTPKNGRVLLLSRHDPRRLREQEASTEADTQHQKCPAGGENIRICHFFPLKILSCVLLLPSPRGTKEEKRLAKASIFFLLLSLGSLVSRAKVVAEKAILLLSLFERGSSIKRIAQKSEDFLY